MKTLQLHSYFDLHVFNVSNLNVRISRIDTIFISSENEIYSITFIKYCPSVLAIIKMDSDDPERPSTSYARNKETSSNNSDIDDFFNQQSTSKKPERCVSSS